MTEADLKRLCTRFFYWWYNSPGSNTEQGFDDWFAEEGEQMLEALSTPTAEPVTGEQAIRAHAHLIRCFADDINERNWDDKRLYIMRQVDRLVGELGALSASPSPVDSRDALTAARTFVMACRAEAKGENENRYQYCCEVLQKIDAALSLPENAEDRSEQ